MTTVLGTTTVAYRVNQRDEVPIKLDAPVRNRAGMSRWSIGTIGKAWPDLQIGDTVSLVLEVSDRYPEPLGPHVVRFEKRDASLFSPRRQYLDQIEKQKDQAVVACAGDLSTAAVGSSRSCVHS